MAGMGEMIMVVGRWNGMGNGWNGDDHGVAMDGVAGMERIMVAEGMVEMIMAVGGRAMEGMVVGRWNGMEWAMDGMGWRWSWWLKEWWRWSWQ